MTDNAYDIELDGVGYMLARREQLGTGGRSWQVTSVGASLTKEFGAAAKVGGLPAAYEFAISWDDLSAGYGAEWDKGDKRYYQSFFADCRFEEGVTPGPETKFISAAFDTANIRKFIEFDGKLFVITDRYCYRINADESVTVENDFGSGKVAFALAVFNNVLYVGMGWSEKIWKRTTAGVWTQATDAVYAGHFAVLNDRLWASNAKNTVRNVAADPFTLSDWSASYTIGESASAITHMIGHNDMLYVGKTDGVYALDGSGISLQLLPELKTSPYVLNCRNMLVWHGILFVPHLRGLFAIINRGEFGFSVQNCNPGMDSNATASTVGFVTGLACDDRWVYAAVKTTSPAYNIICAGREAKADEQAHGPMVWHPIHLALVGCDDLHVSGLWTNPRMFYGNSAGVDYLVLPRSNVNPRQDPYCGFNNQMHLYYPRNDSGAPSTPKIYKSVEVETEGLSTSAYLDVYYYLDEAPASTKLGRVNSSPRSVLQLGGPEGVTGQSIQIMVQYTGPGGVSPRPFIRRLTVRGVERPKQAELIRATIRCADNLPTRFGRPDRRKGETLLANLKTLASDTRAVKLTDLVGSERYVVVVAPVEEMESAQEGCLPREVLAQVHMLSFSTEVTQPIAQVYFTVGTSYWNSGHIFRA